MKHEQSNKTNKVAAPDESKLDKTTDKVDTKELAKEITEDLKDVITEDLGAKKEQVTADVVGTTGNSEHKWVGEKEHAIEAEEQEKDKEKLPEAPAAEQLPPPPPTQDATSEEDLHQGLIAGSVDTELASLPDHTVTISKNGLSAYIINKAIVHSKNAGAKAAMKVQLDSEGKVDDNIKITAESNEQLQDILSKVKAEELA